MAGITCGAKFSLDKWLLQSKGRYHCLALDKFRVNKNKAAEKKYGFSMADSLKKGFAAHTNGCLFKDFTFYIGPGVAGKKNKAPPAADIRCLVEHSGGVVAKNQVTAVSESIHGSDTVVLIVKNGAKMSPKLT